MDSGRKQVKPGTKKAAPGAKPPGKPAAKTAEVKPAPASNETLSTRTKGFVAALKEGEEEGIAIVRKLVVVLTMIVFVLAVALSYAWFNIPRDPLAFSINTKTNQPKRLIGLRGPTMTQQAIMSWVGSTSADILNFGFHNVYERMDGTRKYFTDDGWKSFTEAIRDSGIITRITEKQQVITAAPIGTPVILKAGENEQYGKEWTVQVPIYLTILSGKETDSKRRTLTLILVTVPPEQNLSGLGIDRWVESN